jgi:hypothetical protein
MVWGAPLRVANPFSAGDKICRAYAKAFVETRAIKRLEANLGGNMAQGDDTLNDSALIQDNASVKALAVAGSCAPRSGLKEREFQS